MKKDSKNHVIGRWMRRLTATLALACMTVFAYAQQRVTGTVTDSAGEPIIGASVVVEGTTVGMTTGVDGDFSLNVPANGKLVVSFLGYKTVTVPVAGKTAVNVTLEEDVAMLDDVVVIGYGVVKKRDLTGAVSSVKAETITMTPTSNPMEALQGRVAGLDITRDSGSAGSGVTMQLRGNRSFQASGNPLFIIDGMPGDYSTLNPNDIQSIEVLKDASSTAIYGAAGANGIVIITTKQGEAGKVNVNFNAYVGINGWAQLPTMMSGEEYVESRRQAYRNAGSYVNDEQMFAGDPDYDAYKAGKFIDWGKEILKHNGMTQNYSLSVSGGNDKTKAYMSVNFSDETGQYDNDNNKIYSTNIRVDHKVKDWLTVGTNIQASYLHRNSASVSFYDAIRMRPFGDLYDEEGNYNPFPLPSDNKFVNVLLNNYDNYRNQTQTSRLYVNPYIRISPVKGLTVESRLNASLVNTRQNRFQGQGSYGFWKSDNRDWKTDTYASIYQSRSYNYKWENIFTYNFTVADDHDFTLTGVTSWEHNQNDNAQVYALGIEDNKFLWHNIGGAQEIYKPNTTSGYSMTKNMGLIARLNYSYKSKYLFSASVRYDGASVLAEGHKWATFPAVSAGWRISEEKFMENTKSWLDNLKLRVGYGETGASSIGAYSSLAGISASTFVLGDELFNPFYNLGVKDANGNYVIPNKSLTWERSKSWNIGLDATFFGGRIDLAADYYITNTEGVIWQKPIPLTSGAYNYNTKFYTNVNLAQTKNQGIELTLNTRNIVKKDFTWNSTVTFAYNKEKITSLSGTANDRVENGTDRVFEIGHPVNSFYHYKVLGIWQEEEADEAAIFGVRPGYIKVESPNLERHVENGKVYYVSKIDGTRYDGSDAEHTYAIDSADKQAIGHNSPDWTLGFQNTFTWKNFDLSIYMYMRWGQMISYNMITEFDATMRNNNFANYFVGWTPENRSNDFPMLDESAPSTLQQYTGFDALKYIDGSFFKIKNITLGYTLPKKVCAKIGIQNLRIYGTINNPFVVAKHHLLKDYDPELNGATTKTPLTKQLVFGVNFSF